LNTIYIHRWSRAFGDLIMETAHKVQTLRKMKKWGMHAVVDDGGIT